MKITRRESAQSVLAQCPPERRETLLERMPWLGVANHKQRVAGKRNEQPEQALQIACVKLLRSLPNTLVFSVPNHMFLGKGENKAWYLAKQKMLGLLPGAPDIVLVFRSSSGLAITILLELKSSDGVFSDNQKAVQSSCASIGVPYMVVRSLDDLISLLKLHGHPSFQNIKT